jgi:error-prone DNA polymerase
VPPAPPPRPAPRRLAGADYVELRCRSAFSFLEGASNPEDLVERAAELGHPALALADRGGLYGAPRFHQAAQAAGLRALVGAEVDLDGGAPGARLLLLAESQRGYRHLSRLLTLGHERAGKHGCRVAWDGIEEHAEGLVALLRGDATLAAGSLDRARACFGPGRLWVDVSPHLDAAAERGSRRAVALADAARVPVVAS